MNDKIFLDTNILVYAFDSTDSKKHTIAKIILEDGISGKQSFYISTQVVSEFSSVLTTKIKQPFSAREVSELIPFFTLPFWKVLTHSLITIKNALLLVQKYSISYWDALIIQTMQENEVMTLYSEDAKLMKVKEINVINPFTK